MAVERIAAIGRATPLRDAVDRAVRRPATGETIELRFDAASADEVRVTTAQGLQFKLAGLGALGRDLIAGDVLLMKVLATTPQLELMLFDTPARARAPAVPAAFENEQAAMRSDQVAWLRQVVWQPPDTASMGASWRAMLLGQLERQAMQRELAKGAQTAAATSQDDSGTLAPPAANQPRGALTNPTPNPASNPVSNPTPNPFAKAQPLADPWTLAAFAWSGVRLVLRVVVAERDGGAAPDRREAAPLVLRILLDLPGLGGVTVQLQLAADGVLLDLAVERAEALQPLRSRLPAIVAALAGADLRVLRCGLGRALPNGASWNRAARTATGALPPTRRGQARISTDSALPPPLFRAAAEVIAVLLSPSPAWPVGDVLPALPLPMPIPSRALPRA